MLKKYESKQERLSTVDFVNKNRSMISNWSFVKESRKSPDSTIKAQMAMEKKEAIDSEKRMKNLF